MEHWLTKLWHQFGQTKFRSVALFLVVFFAILGVVALTSEIGFGEEVREHRLVILLAVLALTILFVLGAAYLKRNRDWKSLRAEVKELREKASDLEQQRESAFRMMEHYKEEAQQSIVSRLIQLAIFSLKKSDWQAKGAKIERFRIEESAIDRELNLELTVAEQVTVLINIGSDDEVLEGMRFAVYDPADSQKYGVILVKNTSSSGAACAIVEMSHQAFWCDLVEAIQSENGRSRIVNASNNTIVPESALQGMSRDSAKQLLEWLQTIQRAEL